MEIKNSYKPVVKICGLFRDEDIQAVNKAKPEYCGFIIDYPDSHRNISPIKAHELKRGLSEDIKAVGVFVNKPFMEVAKYLKYGVVDIAQLHGDEDESYIDNLKAEVPDKEIWKVFKISPNMNGKEVRTVLFEAERSLADMIVLDAGFGDGKAFDHTLIKDFKRPYILAGGLALGSLINTLAFLEPYGIDISSGVESRGFKDSEKINQVVYISKHIGEYI